jgi:hypothetical protein
VTSDFRNYVPIQVSAADGMDGAEPTPGRGGKWKPACTALASHRQPWAAVGAGCRYSAKAAGPSLMIVF